MLYVMRKFNVPSILQVLQHINTFHSESQGVPPSNPTVKALQLLIWAISRTTEDMSTRSKKKEAKNKLNDMQAYLKIHQDDEEITSE